MADVTEPASWQLVEFVAGRVRGISSTAGYYTDLGAGLIITDDSDVDDGGDSAATIIAVDRITPAIKGGRHVSSTAELVIEFSVPRGDGLTNPHKLVHRARNDLVRALTFKDRDLPRFISAFEITDTQLADVADDAGSTSVIAQVTARAGLVELATPAQTP